MGRAANAQRERHSRLTSGLRRPAGSPSRSDARSGFPGRFLSRARRAAACALVPALLALVLNIVGAAAPAAAAVLVSNTGQATANRSTLLNDRAHAFTTGGNATGYRLTGVTVPYSVAAPGATGYEIRIHSLNASSEPGTSLGTLTLQNTTADLVATYTASGTGIELDRSTTYFVVLDSSTVSTTPEVQRTASHAEDAGSAPGWSLANASLWKPRAQTAWRVSGNSWKIAVNGVVNPPLPASFAQVSNTGQAEQTVVPMVFDRGQQFITGGNPGGYRLTGAGIVMALSSGTLDYNVTIRTTNAANHPVTTLGTLTNPAKLPTSMAVARFTAAGSGIDLEPNTRYYLVYDFTSASPTATGGFSVTASEAEDAGKAAGWSIRNFGAIEDSTLTWAVSGILRIGIDAVAKAAAPPTAPVSDTPGARVSNTGQANAGSSTSDNDNAQAFTTGGGEGYRLTKVDLDMWIDPGTLPTYSVSVHADSSNDPGTSLGALAKPSLSTGGGTRSFTAAGDGIALAPNTQYWVVLDAAAGTNQRIGWRRTSSTDEDAGAAAGWSLDAARTRGSGSSTWSAASMARKMAVHAVAVTADAPPATPAAPTVSETDGTSITMTWDAPAAGTPGASDYDVRYRRKGDTAWTEHDHTGAARTATITGVLRGVNWEAQVRAGNSVAVSAWSDTGSGHTGPARVERVETHRTNNKWILINFTKNVETGAGPVNRNSYSIVVNGVSRTPIQLTWGAELGLRTTPGITAGQTVTVTYSQPTDANFRLRDSDNLHIASFGPLAVTNLVTAAPAAPAAPTVTAVSGTRSLLVEWTAPDDHLAAITDYDVRYFKGSSDPGTEPEWIEAGETGGHDHVGTATSATIPGLAASAAYRVQVRATNSAGTGPWSASGSGTTSVGLPAAPTGLTVAAGTNDASSFDLSWTEPAETGGLTIDDYDVRYFAGSVDPTDEADWVEETETSGLTSSTVDHTSTSVTVTGLAPSTGYRMQVRAENAIGEGPWSASVTGTTGTASGTNNTPVREMESGGSCVTKTANTGWGGTTAMGWASLFSAGPLVTFVDSGTTTCGIFHDADGDSTLTFTARVSSVPDGVILASNTPLVRAPTSASGGRVFYGGAARFVPTVVRIDVMATDEQGASVSTFFNVRASVLPDTNGAPSLAAASGLVLHVAENEEMEPVVLPAATGGDVSFHMEMDSLDYAFPYVYRVNGLPPGLSFDGPNRKITGRPTKAGTYEVTYTAVDADGVRTDADQASETVRIKVGDGPRINRVRIVSRPTYDSNGDGRNDTYIRGDRILFDVEFGAHQPVKIGGNKQLRLRIDLGTDNLSLNDGSREVLSQYSQLYGDETLRFAYTVQAGDRDTDGVWVQTGANNQVVFIPGTATVVHADTGAGADLTLRGLPTRGDPLHKVDGSKTAADVGPLPKLHSTGDPCPPVVTVGAPCATVNGDTLTVTFDEQLNTSVNTGELRWDLAVQGTLNTGDRTADLHPDSVSVSNETKNSVTRGKLTLTLGAAARPGETVTLSYTGSLLRGTGGKKAPMFRDLAVTNSTSGAAGPKPVRAVAAGNKLAVHFDGALAGLPDASAFAVRTSDADGDGRLILGTAVNIGPSFVVVTLAEPVRPGDLVTVSYTKPAISPLTSGVGSAPRPEVLSFDRFRVQAVTDAVPPKLLGGGVAQTSETPAESRAALYFDEALDAASVPATGDFAARVGATAVTVTDVAVEGNAVALTLDRLAAAGTAFTVSYTPGANRIRDAAGNPAAAFVQTLSAAATGAPVLQSAVVSGARVELTFDRPLDPASVPEPETFTLAHRFHAGDGGDRTTRNADVEAVAVEGRRVVLHLVNPVPPCAGPNPFDVAYGVPADSPLQGLDGTPAVRAAHQVTNARVGWCGVGWFDHARSGSVIIRAKRPFDTSVPPQAAWFTVTASGGPVTVTGAAFDPADPHELKLTLDRAFEADETATVSYLRPPDARGLWSVDGYQLADLADATVTMGAGPPSGPALTAEFVGVPAWHGGRGSAFALELVFSENFGGRLDYRVLKDRSLQVTNGRVTGVRRVAQGRNDRWTITVRPQSFADVTVRLAATADCSVSGAICTPDGRKLSNAVSATVLMRANQAATGAPAVSGTAQVGETLTASTAGIADADGLTGAAFAFQWLSNGGGADADIAGATGASHTLTDAERGRTVKVRVTFTDDAGKLETLTSAPTPAVAPRPNRPATGAPAIAGTAQAGETLSASTAGIDDADGLTGAAFAYQWIAIAGGEADIAGATAPTYTLADADVGTRIKVRVSFTDDAGHAETLTSEPTAAVLPRPLSAVFHGVPAEHDGRKLFRFELVFSDDFGGRFDYRVLRDQALQVSGGRVVEATRLAPGRNDRWTIKVRPASYGDVTVTLPAGSVVTESGRTLSNTVSATVRGPALLSVADARAAEGDDPSVDFAVTLSRAASSEATVEYVTLDGTAVAGEDYTRTRGTLTFAPGETEKTVSVPILDDAIDEGEETFTLKLRNAKGAYIVDDEATGTIENDDPMARAWTARFGRTVAVHVVDAVESRLDGAPESYMQVGGHRLGGGPDVQETVQRLAPQRDLWAEQDEAAADPAGRTMTFRDLLLGSAFHLVSNTGQGATGPSLSAWGRVATSGFDGREDALTLDGTVTTATLGVDGAWKRWITGLLLAYSEGDGSFSQVGTPGGDVSSSLTSLHPYAAYTLSDRVRLWGLVGYGSGALRLQEIGRSPIDTDLSMTMGALGVRGDLLRPSPRGGLQLALRSDVLWTGMDSAEVEGRMAATEAQASRLRLVLEGSRPVALAGGGAFVPSLEVGLRHDGGDADTGTGVEVGGRLRFTSAGGLTIEASVRGLLAHEAEDYTEWGASGALRYDPGRQGRGFTAAIVPTWGMAASGVQQLWGQQTTAGLAPLPGVVAPTAAGRVEAELGYGLAALKGRGLLTPYARVALTEGADQAWHLGTRLLLAENLNFSLEASRRASEGGPTAHDLALLATLGF